jgi:Holliday junction resolvase RusA-like endonuclease
MSKTYDFVIEGIIPATQNAFKNGGISQAVRVRESKSLKEFKHIMSNSFGDRPSTFPTSGQVFVAIIQFYTSTKDDYNCRDVDNMAKTILDVLGENHFYSDDSQVRTLLVSKRVDLKKAPQNFGYVYVEILEDGEDKEEVGDLVLNALTLYQDFKARKVEIT